MAISNDWQLGVELYRFMGDACRSIHRPVTCRNVVIVDQKNRTLEDMYCILVDPTIPVTFIKLLT